MKLSLLVFFALAPLALLAQVTTPDGQPQNPTTVTAQPLKVVKHLVGTCPIMEGNPVSETDSQDMVYVKDGVEHHVYVCCGTCARLFKANPEKYLAKVEAMEAAQK